MESVSNREVVMLAAGLTAPVTVHRAPIIAATHRSSEACEPEGGRVDPDQLFHHMFSKSLGDEQLSERLDVISS